MRGLASALAERYWVFVPERRGHGCTPDTPGPYTYEQGASDTVALMEGLACGPAHLVGISGGASIAVLAALARPDLVRSVVLQGTYLNLGGAVPEAVELFRSWTAASVPEVLAQMYIAVSPDGASHFPIVVEKIARLAGEAPRISLDRLASLEKPTLVLVSDDDVLTLEHAVAQFRALPHGQLAVIPGTSHAAFLEKPALFAALVLDFLDNPIPPPPIMPFDARRVPR